MRAIHCSLFAVLALVALSFPFSVPAQGQEQADYARWYFSPGLGLLITEGDGPLGDGGMINLRLGYDWNEWWTIEGGLLYAPSLDEQDVGVIVGQDASGNPIEERGSQANPAVAGFGDTWALLLSADALFHFTRWERLDPYLAGGVGLVKYGEDALLSGKGHEFLLRGGGGVMYHLTDEWALRADSRLMLTSDHTDWMLQADVGAVWTWGARVPPDLIAVDGPMDSDGDGLTDRRESELGTDPYDPDSDDDGLSDGEEVDTYRTDPRNPDTDYDLLKDGAEVHKYRTDPLDRDTDDGGVSDGHEVIEDGTNPLVGADDLMLIELNIQFDYDKAVIKSEYYDDLDTVAKVLQRHPGSTAVIEGHADRLRKSDARYNRRLSQRRADAVREYLVLRGKIGRDRLKAVGYGFDRPKAEPDLVNGTPENRRVEIYIRGAGNTP